MSHRPRAFTLLELLIVVAIIGVLTSLLLPAISLVRFRSQVTVTGQRMEEITRRAAQVVVEHRTLSGALQEAGLLPGVSQLAIDASGRLSAATGSWLAYDQTWHLRFPLGRPVFTYDVTGRLLHSYPRDVDLGNFDPQATPELLVFFELAPDAARVRDDRSSSEKWNDAWGNPLLVARALYQYGPDTAGSWPAAGPGETLSGTSTFDRAWQQAVDTYRDTRQLYLICGALGPRQVIGSPTDATLPASWTSWWSELRNDADRDASGAALWRIDYPDLAAQATLPNDPADAVNALQLPPWKGQRLWKDKDRARMLGEVQILP